MHLETHIMELKQDSSPEVKLKFMTYMIPTLNEEFGPLDQALVLDLIIYLNELKNDTNKEISHYAFELDEDIKFHKSPSKEVIKAAEERNEKYKRIEQAL